MAAFHLELVSPERLLFSGDVNDVLVPGTEGEFVVMAGHAPVMTALRPGVVDIGDAEGKHTRLYVRGGFADVTNTSLTLLAESAIPLAELDTARLDQEIKDVEEDVADATAEAAKKAAQERLDRLRELKAALKM
jgi:F-type H+-transporting ATPase subunit epsilon